MENNQEHKIDKIFKKSLENQPIIPPTDAWMGIHTYTIGQEEKKPKVWLKYASLAMLLLLISGFGVWYIVDNQRYTSKLLTQKVISEGTDHGVAIELKNAGRVQNPASVRNGKAFSTPVISLPTSSLVHLQTLPNTILSYSKQIPELISTEDGKSEDQLRDETLLMKELLVENTNTGEANLEITKSKPLILNDLIDKIQKENEGKILSLEENTDDKKAVYKADLVVYGDRFSLRHPIVNFRLGLFNSSVSINANQGGNNPFDSDRINPNSIYGFSGIIGIAWKLNNKSRISLNAKFVNYSAINPQSKSAAAYVDPLSSTNKPTGTFKYNASKDVHEYLTPFGYITQPIDPKLSSFPKDFDVWFSGSITNLQIGLNYEHDLIAFRNKKSGIPAMEIYGLVGINIQKIRKYRTNYALFENYDPQKNNMNYIRTNTNITTTNLENGSPIVFGYNTGLGFRFQLSKRFGLNISGNYETNINSWVKDLPFTTRLSVLSVESGFFVNL